ncbi:tRNA dihydrouridine synthase DusB [bacterium]|nr:tRNA dihydrouridine synthase DusB [bacterium]
MNLLIEIDKKGKDKSTLNQPQSKFTIGNWELPAGNILAPMAGTTDSPYRRITRRFGSGLLYSECISAEGLRRSGRKSLELVKFHPDERPIAIQLFGSEPRQFAEAASIIAEMFQPDMIDINCGCPVKRMVSRNSGGFLMQYPELIGEIVAETRNATGLPVSVKLRTGYRQPDDTAQETAVIAEAAGASLIAIHARYVRSSWSSNADWQIIGDVKEAVKTIPVVGNGDVRTWEDIERMKTVTDCDRVMIGRGARGRPWIFSADPYIPTDREKIDVLLDHYILMLDYMPEIHAVKRMRKHFNWYTKGMPNAARLRERVMKIENPAEVMEILVHFREEIS